MVWWCAVLLRQLSQNPMLTKYTYNGTEELGRRLCIATTEKKILDELCKLLNQDQREAHV